MASTAGFTILHFVFLAPAGVRGVPCMVTDHGSADDDVTAAGVVVVVVVAIIVVVIVVVVVVIVVVDVVARALSFLFL